MCCIDWGMGGWRREEREREREVAPERGIKIRVKCEVLGCPWGCGVRAGLERQMSVGVSILAPVGGRLRWTLVAWEGSLLGRWELPACFSSNENHSSLELTMLTVNERWKHSGSPGPVYYSAEVPVAERPFWLPYLVQNTQRSIPSKVSGLQVSEIQRSAVFFRPYFPLTNWTSAGVQV